MLQICKHFFLVSTTQHTYKQMEPVKLPISLQALQSENTVLKATFAKTIRELDSAMVAKKMWETSCDALLIKRDEAIKDRDAAIKQRDQAVEELTKLKCQCADLEKQRMELSKENASLKRKRNEDETFGSK